MIDQNIQNLSRQIKQTVARVIRPLSLHVTQGLELAIAFTFLRRIDCMIGQYSEACHMFYSRNKDMMSDNLLDKNLREISGGYTFYNVSGYTFEGFLRSGLSVELAFNSYMQGFNLDIRDLFSDLGFSNNVAILQRQSRYLVDLFEFFSKLDLSEYAVSNKQFIDLVTKLVTESSIKGQLAPTPEGLSELICECLFCEEVCEGLIYNEPSEDISIYDPVCGTGSLLAYAGERAKSLALNNKRAYLIGKEISPISSAIANFLILFTGDDNSFVRNADSLTDADSDDLEYQFVVADLPLGLSWAPIKGRVENESRRDAGRFARGIPSTTDSQFLFIQEIVSKMDCLGGRAAIITSDYVLQAGAVDSGEARIRKWLIESGLVETIIALPKSVYVPYINTPVYLWILTCNENYGANEFTEKMDGKVRLIDANRLISSKDKLTLNDEFITSVLREYKSLSNTEATRIVKREDLGFYELKLWDDDEVETVKISLDTDIKTFVEKERKPYAKGEITIDYSSAEKGYSIDFSKFFKTEDAPIPSIESESSNILAILDAIVSLRKDITTIANGTDTQENEVWREMPLRAATEIVNGGNCPRTTTKQGLPIISVANLRGETADVERYTIANKSRCITPTDVILIKTGANAGEVFKGMEGILSTTLVAVRSTDESIIRPQFLYYLLKGYEKILRQMTGGYAIKSMNTRAILDLKLRIPTIELQDKISIFLNDIVGKIDNIMQLLDSSDNVFSQYRQTLIENAVRGRIRLI